MSEVASLRRVSKVYRRGTEEIHALSDVSLDIHAGELTAVVGPSGSGKTTLLNVLGCVDTPTSGELLVGDLDPASLTDGALARLRQSHVGFVFQQFFLIPSLTAEENVLMPTLFSRKKRNARDLLDLVGLGHRAKHRPGEMSGGEMQRVAIARALVNEPRLLLADEPTGNLDTARATEIFALLQRIASSGTAVVIVTHNDELAHATRRVLRMRDGRLVSDAPGRASAATT
jgi:putative ABC transport system ATP-binding protein